MLDVMIITGATKGIGANIVKESFSLCKNMIVIGSSKEVKKIKSESCNVIPLQLDQYYYESVYEDVLDAVCELGGVGSIGIVLCGAQLGEHGGLFSNSLSHWDYLFRCNVLGNLAVIRGCHNQIVEGAKLRVAFFAGGGAAYGYPEFSGYAITKVAVVREVENLAMEFKSENYDASIIAVAPGAVATDMLKKVMSHGGQVKTKTDISEPTNFVINFLHDKFDSKGLNGRFLHVRDDVKNIDFSTANPDLFKLRRVQ
jgi:NADP-dependent 3-hydroxy acid dehydrogenase YdfG